MGLVFISYSRKDIQTVDNLVARLKKDGFEIWIDRANIKGGDLWTVAIVEAIDTADSFVLMLSPSSTASDNVRKEVQLAQDAQRKLFPLLIEAVKLPPQFRYQLAGIQIIDFTNDPETKYAELVEVLHTNQQSLIEVKQPETRQVETVMSEGNVSKFGAVEKEKLLDALANIAETARTNLKLTNVSAGSVHAFVEMPRHAAYILKTAALNSDKRLLKHKIDALKLDGEENYVLVNSGEIGPLDLPKPKPSLFKGVISSILVIGIIVAAIFAFLPNAKPLSPTPTQELTATQTQTPRPTQTFTPIFTFTATATLKPVLGVPEAVSPKDQATVSCDSRVLLTWNAPKASNRITGYEVSLDVNANRQVKNIFVQQVDGDSTQLDITRIVYANCKNLLVWRVRAMDSTKTWSDWSADAAFLAQNTPPSAPTIGLDPQYEGNKIPCNSSAQLFWKTPYDASGIINYRIQIFIYKDGWVSLIDKEIGDIESYDISSLAARYCGFVFQAQVMAQDNHKDWGPWSPMFDFSIELPIPG